VRCAAQVALGGMAAACAPVAWVGTVPAPLRAAVRSTWRPVRVRAMAAVSHPVDWDPWGIRGDMLRVRVSQGPARKLGTGLSGEGQDAGQGPLGGWPGGIVREDTLRGLMEMMRPESVPAEFLVTLGGSLAAARGLSALACPAAWGIAVLTTTVGLASMICNDYWDYRAGVDTSEFKRHKVLVRGLVHPEQALLAGSALYVAALCSALLLLESFPLRLLVAAGTFVTFVYTPFLKGVPVLKNLAVGAVVSHAVVAGGMAVGDLHSLQYTALPALYVFFAVLWREVFMDVIDSRGDALARVRTIPVIFGREFAGAVAILCACLAALTPFIPLMNGHQLGASFPGWEASFAVAFMQIPLVAAVIHAVHSGYQRDSMRMATRLSMISIGCSVLMLIIAPDLTFP